MVANPDNSDVAFVRFPYIFHAIFCRSSFYLHLVLTVFIFNPWAGYPGFQAGDECNLASGGSHRISSSVVRGIVTENKGATG
jgi:hypothetical protein